MEEMLFEEDMNSVPIASFDTTLLKMVDPKSASVLNVERNAAVYIASIHLGGKRSW
jgi:hypothetical protein